MTFDYTPIDLNLPPLSTVEGAEGRLYVTPNGIKLPSVTTVTGFEGKDGFDIWRRKNPLEAVRVVQRGNRIHSMMESLLKNEEVALIEDMADEDVDALYRMLKDHASEKIGRIHGLELQMWSEKIGLAGRADCICEYDGVLSVVDFKGSTREKNRSGIKNYFQQATAYSLMFEEITGMKVPQIVILVACETGTLQVFKEKPIDHIDGLVRAMRLYRQWNELKSPSLITEDQ